MPQVIDGMVAAGIPEDAIVPVYEKALRSIQEREAANAKGEFDEAATAKEDYHHWYDASNPILPDGATCVGSLPRKLVRTVRPLFTRNPAKLSVFLPTPLRRS